MPNFDEKTFVPDENIDWLYISRHQNFSEEFIERNYRYIFFDYLCLNSFLSFEVSSKMIRILHNKDINDYFEFRERVKDRML